MVKMNMTIMWSVVLLCGVKAANMGVGVKTTEEIRKLPIGATWDHQKSCKTSKHGESLCYESFRRKTQETGLEPGVHPEIVKAMARRRDFSSDQSSGWSNGTVAYDMVPELSGVKYVEPDLDGGESISCNNVGSIILGELIEFICDETCDAVIEGIVDAGTEFVISYTGIPVRFDNANFRGVQAVIYKAGKKISTQKSRASCSYACTEVFKYCLNGRTVTGGGETTYKDASGEKMYSIEVDPGSQCYKDENHGLKYPTCDKCQNNRCQ